MAIKKNVSNQLLYCNQSMGMGGAEVFILDLLRALQKRGWQVSVASTNADFVADCVKANVSVKKLDWIMDVIGNWKGLLKALVFGPLASWQWWRVLTKTKGSILLSGFNEKLLVTPLASWLGLDVVWIEFSSLAPILSLWGGIVGYWYRSQLPSVRKIITSSEHSKQKLMAELGLDASKIVVIPCGSNQFLNAENQLVIKKKNSLVCVSRLQPGKGQDLLIKALPAVVKKFPNVHLTLVGEGDFLDSLQRLVAQLQLKNSVTFTGRVPNSRLFLQQAELVVFPSTWELEGFGLVVIEAMSAKVPVVTFNRGPMNEVIQDKKNGWLVPTGSVVDLSAAIIKLLENPLLRQKLVDQAYLDFQKKYTITIVAERYDQNLTLYHS